MSTEKEETNIPEQSRCSGNQDATSCKRHWE